MTPERSHTNDLDCEAFGRALRAHEHRAKRPASTGTASQGEPAVADLCHHVQSCTSCRSRYRRRVTALDGLVALRCRETPAGTFEGLYDEIRARTPYAAPGGGMSPVFLDAPRALRAWRTAALAASLLLAVGTGFALTGGLSTERPPSSAIRPLHDPREGLLETLGPIPLRPEDRLQVRPGSVPVRRGLDGFFEDPSTQPVNHQDAFRREIRLR